VSIDQMRAKGIQAYQDYTFMVNDQPDRRLDDEQLLADWRAALPDATGTVFTGTLQERRTLNKGLRNHGHRNPDGSLSGPARTLSLPYRDGRTYVYSERWLRGCESARAGQ
jgi:hypothetical protein